MDYEQIKNHWDEIFEKESATTIQTKSSGHLELDKALDWLCDGSRSVLDFGCGNGTSLYKCALRGTKRHLGIDISDFGIELATEQKIATTEAKFNFICGSIEELKHIEPCSFDSILLFNIVDNLKPEDAVTLMEEIHRIVKPHGKVLIKLNPYININQIKEWNLKVIQGDLLDTGLFLWNQTTKQWKSFFRPYFNVAKFKDIYYKEYDQSNRVFLLTKQDEYIR